MVAGIRRTARRLSGDRSDLVLQIALFAGCYAAYRLTRGAADGRAAIAVHHAWRVVDLERALHVFVEPALQRWTDGVRPLSDVAAWLYVNSQTTVTIGSLAWLYLRRRPAYRRVRDTLLVAMAIALVVYVAFPAAPPRLLPGAGFTDTVARLTGGAAGAHGAGALYNPYAAIPSMHVAFAAIFGTSLARVVRSRVARALWLAYPGAMALVVVVTANHFLFDVALGALTAVVASVLAGRRAAARAGWLSSEAGLPA